MRWFDIPDELLPPVYKAIKDVYAYARTLDTELRNFLATMYYIRRNFFVQTCDAATLQDWIALLRIPMYGPETEQEKRELVLMYLNNQRPATEPFFRSLLTELFGEDGYTLSIDPTDPLRVNIEFLDSNYQFIRQFGDWFVRMVPAHILWEGALVEPSHSIVDCSSECVSATFCTCKATSSTGTQTIYLGNTAYTADWVEV